MSSIFNINIAVIGTVSSGKSTLLNSLFLEEFTSMNISRNTMIPQIYHEINSNKNKLIKEAKQINKEVSEINEFIKNKTNDNDYDIKQDMQPKEFYIHKIKELNICKRDIYLSFYDIPGLNDNKNHEVYYHYVRENFSDFDIILYLIDLNTGLNTKDEIDLLRFICIHAKKHNNFVIPIINKSDDMTMKESQLICDGKYSNNYDTIINIFNEYQNKYPNPKIQKIILFSAQESYMYRMLLQNPNFELSDHIKNIIGFNDMGRKYYTLSNEERLKKINEIVNDTEFLKTMIRMSGYSYLHNMLSEILNSNQQTICENKLIKKFEKLKNKENINTENIFDIYKQFNILYENSVKLKNIFTIELDLINDEQFINDIFDKLISKIEHNNLDNMEKYLKCFENLNENKYNKYLGEKINSNSSTIKANIYSWFYMNYEKKNTIEDLLSVLKKMQSFEISDENINEYATNYINDIITNKIIFYNQVDFSNYQSIIEFDRKIKQELNELCNYVYKETIKKIYKYFIKSKIMTLIDNINSKNNEDTSIMILYNLMLFYNHYSTINIEYSEIYILLLFNYIKVVNNNTNININIISEKNDELLSIDNDFIQINVN